MWAWVMARPVVGLFLWVFRVEGRWEALWLGDEWLVSVKQVVEQGVPCCFPGPVSW